jgi:hypothetical protein
MTADSIPWAKLHAVHSDNAGDRWGSRSRRSDNAAPSRSHEIRDGCVLCQLAKIISNMRKSESDSSNGAECCQEKNHGLKLQRPLAH